MQGPSSLRSWTNAKLGGQDPFTIVASSVLSSVSVLLLAVILSNPKGAKKWVLRKLFRMMRRVPAVNNLIEKESAGMKNNLKKSMNPYTDVVSFAHLPTKGIGQEEALSVLKKLKGIEDDKWKVGKVSGAVYQQDEYTEFLAKAYTLFCVSNPLHTDLFPSLKKFEAEIITMTASMFKPVIKNQDSTYHISNDPQYAEICGVMTSGGTESIIMAIKTYRDRARVLFPHISHPEIVAPISAHAAFNKGCGYFDVKLVSVAVDEKDGKANVARMRAAINQNTILLVGSASSFPHGAVDPIPELAKLATEFKLPLHVDACLGGFVLPFLRSYLDYPLSAFDFSVPEVTSISVDPHKYGQTTKGVSVLLFRSPAIRKYMYFKCVDWPGGLYASASMAGSRSGATIASAWATMTSLGLDFYIQQAKDIALACDHLKKKIPEIDGLMLLGAPDYPVVAFTSKSYNILRVNDEMAKLGWHLNACQKPPGMHICVTARTANNMEEFLHDLQRAVGAVKVNPTAKGGMAPIYGMVEAIPDDAVIEDFLTAYIDSTLDSPSQ